MIGNQAKLKELACVMPLRAGNNKHGYADSVLLLKRADNDDIEPSRWDLPKGHLEIGEKPKAAAHRELLEETGIAVPIAKIKHLARYPTAGRLADGKPYPVFMHQYVVTLPRNITEHDILTSADHSEAMFMDLTDIPRLRSEEATTLPDYKILHAFYNLHSRFPINGKIHPMLPIALQHAMTGEEHPWLSRFGGDRGEGL